MSIGYLSIAAPFALACACTLLGCGGKSEASSSGPTAGACIAPETVADYVHTVIESDRATYAQKVVHRLQNVEKVLKASEEFEEDKALPLPSQMLRMGAAAAAQASQGKMRYALISEWAINKANLPKTDFEKQGLKALAKAPDKPARMYQELDGKRYFMTLYADKAVSQACIDCHNMHPESPRSDFKLGEVMGGVVVSMLVE
jgi:hypothetical protein